MYQNPALSAPPGPDGLPQPVDPTAAQEHFEVFFQMETIRLMVCRISMKMYLKNWLSMVNWRI